MLSCRETPPREHVSRTFQPYINIVSCYPVGKQHQENMYQELPSHIFYCVMLSCRETTPREHVSRTSQPYIYIVSCYPAEKQYQENMYQELAFQLYNIYICIILSYRETPSRECVSRTFRPCCVFSSSASATTGSSTGHSSLMIILR